MFNKSSLLLLVLVSAAIVFGAAWYILKNPSTTVDTSYNPTIVATDYLATVDNQYFTLTPGKKFTYENRVGDGVERIEVVVTGEKKAVLGVQATVVWDRVWLDGVLIEDTKDWYAQHRDGSVWYFGEAVDNYEDGKLQDHDGSWEAGVDGAQPGIVMLAAPKVGDSYRQEYYAGQAEDMGDIVSLDTTVAVPYGTFAHCLQTRDWSRIETGLNEHKYYCPEVGFVALEESVPAGEERVELVGVTSQ